jgi:hypothetical protein
MLRSVDGVAESYLTRMSRMDYLRFRTESSTRLRDKSDRLQRVALPLSPESQELMREAINRAREGRRGALHSGHVLAAMLRDESGLVTGLLERYGGQEALITAALDKGL